MSSQVFMNKGFSFQHTIQQRQNSWCLCVNWRVIAESVSPSVAKLLKWLFRCNLNWGCGLCSCHFILCGSAFVGLYLPELYRLSRLFLCSLVPRPPRPRYEASFCAAHSTSCRAITIQLELCCNGKHLQISHTEHSTESDKSVLGKVIQMWWILFLLLL